jgi:hypothetical protein
VTNRVLRRGRYSGPLAIVGTGAVTYAAIVTLWPEWKVYEEQLHAQLSAKAVNATVTFDEHGRQRLPGRYSEIDRQIDVIVRGEFAGLPGEHTMIVDCKCMGRNIDVCDVEQFIGLLDDVGAPLGLLVTTQGFSDAARKRARGARGVLLDVVAYDELLLWQLRNASVSLTHGATFGSVVYFNGADFVTRTISRELAEKLLASSR